MQYEVIFRCRKHDRDLLAPYGVRLHLNYKDDSKASFHFGFTELYCAPDNYDGESEIEQCQEHWYTEGPYLVGEG